MATTEEMEAFMTVIYYTPAINNDLDTTSSATLWGCDHWSLDLDPSDPMTPAFPGHLQSDLVTLPLH